jgi:hypothetical protein
MKRRAVVLVTLLWLVACPGPGLSQVTVAPPPPPTAAGLSTEGEVRRIDGAQRRITLDTGEEYVIPPTLDGAWALVREGSQVRLRYNVDGGRNIVSSVTVIR